MKYILKNAKNKFDKAPHDNYLVILFLLVIYFIRQWAQETVKAIHNWS